MEKKKDEMPYAVRFALAMLAHDSNAAAQVVTDSIGTITGELLAVAEGFKTADLPFVVASMQIAANYLTNLLDEPGRRFSDDIASHVSCITVDVAEMKKQMKEDGGSEKVDN